MNQLQRKIIQFTYERKNLSKMVSTIDNNLKQIEKLLNKKNTESGK